MKTTAKKVAAPLPETATFKVYGCARCGGEHMVTARLFKGEPIEGFNAWASCPTTGDPLLVGITADPTPTKKDTNPMATPRPTSRTADEEELVAKFHRERIAAAADFLTNAGEVSNEVASGLVQISEQARGILAGPLTEHALLVLLQPRCRKRKNGDLMPFEDILSVLKACASLDEYLIAAKGGR